MSHAVALLLDVGAVEEGVGLVAAGLAQEVGVDLLHHRVLVAAAVGHALILPVEGGGPEGLDVGEVAHVGVLDGLAAAVDAA